MQREKMGFDHFQMNFVFGLFCLHLPLFFFFPFFILFSPKIHFQDLIKGMFSSLKGCMRLLQEILLCNLLFYKKHRELNASGSLDLGNTVFSQYLWNAFIDYFFIRMLAIDLSDYFSLYIFVDSDNVLPKLGRMAAWHLMLKQFVRGLQVCNPYQDFSLCKCYVLFWTANSLAAWMTILTFYRSFMAFYPQKLL